MTASFYVEVEQLSLENEGWDLLWSWQPPLHYNTITEKKILLFDSLGLKFYIIIVHIMVAPEGIS